MLPNDISERDYRFMELARKTAELSLEREYRFGAVITSGSQIISIACNSSKTHPYIYWRNKYIQNKFGKLCYGRLHSETRAIILAKTNLKGCTIYIYRARNLGDAGDSFPCNFCLPVIIEVGIKKIVFIQNGQISLVKI